MSYPPLPSNGETSWGDKFRAWADALEGRKVEGEGMKLRVDTSAGTRLFLDHPGGSTMLYGDTGWRDFSQFLAEGFEPGIYAKARRENGWVEIVVHAKVKPDAPFIGQALGSTNLFETPNGFRTVSTYMINGIAFYKNKTYSLRQSTVTDLRIVDGASLLWAAGDALSFRLAYFSTQHWNNPTPGTPL